MAGDAFDAIITRTTVSSVSAGRTQMVFGDQLAIGNASVDYPAILSCRAEGSSVRLEWPAGVVEMQVADPPALVRRIAERACMLPELTLAMRSLGSRHAGPAEEHDRFFVPLVRARAEAERAKTPRARVRAFDAVTLLAMVESTTTSLAAAREPKSAPHQRALEAQLREFGEPLVARLETLRDAAMPLLHEPPSDTVAAWCRWATAVRAVFEEADRFWERVRRHLDMPGRRPRARTTDGVSGRG